MKRLSIAFTGLLLVATAATAEEGRRVETSGSIEAGVQQLDNDTGSSKLTEYRDLADEAYLAGLRLDVFDTKSGRLLEIRGSSLTRDDRNARLGFGRPGAWGLDLRLNEIPHLLSNKARTPFNDKGNGLFDVPSTIPVTFKKLGTAASDAANVLATDTLTAAYLADTLRGAPLDVQRRDVSAAFRYTALDAIKLRLGYKSATKEGNKVGYGPVGDRPPRTLNVQLGEPVDYKTQDIKVEIDHLGKGYQVQLSYLRSDFENEIDTFTWQNVYATGASGATFDTWDRSVSTFGRRPLAPDNSCSNASLTFGADLPLGSRLTITAARGRTEQDQTLLPYSFNSNVLVNSTLPRATAEARIDTTHVQATYTFNPVQGLDVRAHYRYYDLDNETPSHNWQYVTSDTPNNNGTVTFKNKRVSLAYGYKTQTIGADATYRLGFWRGSLGLGYQVEKVERSFRESDTDEGRLTASLRLRPSDTLTLRARYLLGDRDGDTYNTAVTSQSYWYTPAEVGTDNDNPAFTFTNHPDMRRYDVSDRKRNQMDVNASWTPRSAFTATLSLRSRKDDFDSDVRPSQPLLGTTLADREAASPGDQLGRLEDERLQYTLDLLYAPGERFSMNVFGSVETAESRQRGLEFDENHKQDPGPQATKELGPWTRASSQWSADSDDSSRSVGLGVTYVLKPGKASVSASYTLSRGEVEILYSGYGVTSFDGKPFPDTHQFGFRTPPVIQNDLDAFDLTFDYTLNAHLSLAVSYLFDKYGLQDWQQEASAPWFESVGSETLLRDSSRSHQWGNRLINLGSYLAPSYEAHIGYMTLTYRF